MPSTISRLIAIVSSLIIGIVAVACGDSSTSGGGDAASDFTLPVANRPTYVTLSDFQDDQNVVLVFYRGFF